MLTFSKHAGYGVPFQIRGNKNKIKRFSYKWELTVFTELIIFFYLPCKVSKLETFISAFLQALLPNKNFLCNSGQISSFIIEDGDK